MRVTIPINYENTHFYIIYCKDTNIKDCYIGHTTNFNNRKGVHKHSLKNNKTKLTNAIINNGNWDNWIMEILETITVEKKEDVLKRERYWIEQKKSTLNTNIPSQTQQERHNKNRLKINEYMRIYNKNKKDIIKRQEYLEQFIKKHLIIINSLNRY